MLLEEVINNCFIENLQDFFSYRNSNFRRIQEDYSNYRDENFFEIKSIGELEFDEITKIKFFYIETSKELNHRSIKKLQYDLGKKIIRDNSIDAGIFIFYDKSTGNFRFSFIYVEYLGIRREFSYYKRFTFFVSPSLTNKTFIDQISKCNFSSINEIKEAFSVEPVTKQFYKELQNWYFYSLDKVYFPSNENEINLIRLITRIIFIWFIKEKGLINPDLFDKNKIKDIVKDFYEDKEAHNYYNAILQNLFFATLNQKIEERRFVKEGNFNENKKEYGIKNLFRYKDKFLIEKEEDILKLFENIPFLNGGLFDCLDKEDESNKIVYIEGFSRNESKKAKIPDYLFFEEKEINCDLSKYGLEKNAKVRGLIDILQSYNFTIDEASEIDQEVALDPELLGKVFENLLASYNEETKENARKQTGSFYTPREIVNFMVTQSLSKYFENKFIEKFNINDEKKIKEIQEKLNDLLSYNEEKHKFDDEEVNLLINSIDNIKILDPACGSGAFPMGILHKIVFILSKLDPNNEKWKNKQIEKANNIDDYVIREKTIDDIEKSFENNELDYGRKLYIVQNCIFGVDIQNIAIQISKLRFFISLVIDQDIKRNDYNFGIIPLPNLETKFVCANALIDIKRNENEVLTFLSNSLNVIDTNIHSQIKEKEEKLKKVRENYFNAKTFQQKKKCIEKDNQIRNEIINLLIENKFDENEAKKLAKWNPYDPNSSADFFNSEWMFGITDGFDIVIGNPPYGASYSNQEKEYFKSNYQSAKTIKNIQKGSLDTFTLFIEKGFNLLKKNGCLSYIIPLSFTSSDSMVGIHKLLENNCKEIEISSFAVRPQPIFKNAVINTSILIFVKTLTKCEKIFSTKMYRKNKKNSLENLLKKLEFIDVFNYKLKGRYPKISYEIEKQILDKIFSKKNTPIKELISNSPTSKKIYYRASGGRYFKVITNFSTGSSTEKYIQFEEKIANLIGAILSSNLYFWFYQIYSDNLSLKMYEIENFRIPLYNLTDYKVQTINSLYENYLNDIQKNSILHEKTNYSGIDSFREYKIGKSKAIIDKIDDFICPLYYMNNKEIEFIKNYEIEFRYNYGN
ncbi:MAG: restriction endonuclease subunit M [Candidatus Sericytochromatia bacterium]|nr:MAG: restriction endonuclease subunit M [Candidatus Sericytochromatia bacterium]